MENERCYKLGFEKGIDNTGRLLVLIANEGDDRELGFLGSFSATVESAIY
nr:hypothetical protein Iba_chr10aCG17360 [Ipomoea batatas]GME06438.1 hypothetical protein Iba_scaffold4177CG0020 [Ipomoea batatas]GME13806.1 hypothetical protein Iba_scaffold14718CG0020 [Ipomoea batatas]